MKKSVSLVAAIALVAGATAAFATGGNSNITYSKHNLQYNGPIGSANNYATSANTRQICVYCHTPHNATKNVPLWNRRNPTGTFTLYSSNTLANTSIKSGFTSDSISLFCMSCHDGSSLGGMVVNTPNNDGTVIAGGIQNTGTVQANLGKNLANTHPVNFNLTSAGQIRNDGSADLVYSTTNTPTYMGRNAASKGNLGSYPLFASQRGNYTLECSSCHAVHDDFFNPFLRSTMTGSALCLGCHNK